MATSKNCFRVTLAPYKNFSKSPTLYMIFFWALLFPQIAMLFATKSYSALAVIFSAMFGALCSEWRNFYRLERVNFCAAYSVLTGTLIGFFLPETFPPASVFFLSFAFLSISKTVFGSQGVSWINPVALVVAAAWFCGHFNFPSFEISGEDLLLKNPSLALIESSSFQNSFDAKVTAFLNDRVFSAFGIAVPEGYASLFWDSGSAIPAFRFSFLTLASSVIMIAFEMEGGIVPLTYLAVYSLLVRFASPAFTGASPLSGDILLALLSSGTLAAAFFLLQWHGTLPYSRRGKILYAALGGVFAFVFCGTGTSPVGSAMAVLFTNLFSPAIVLYEDRVIKRKVSKTLLQNGIARKGGGI